MSWDRNNLAPHALPSFLCDSLSSSSAGLNLGRHPGQFGTFPMVAGNGPNTSIGFSLLTLGTKNAAFASRASDHCGIYCTVLREKYTAFCIHWSKRCFYGFKTLSLFPTDAAKGKGKPWSLLKLVSGHVVFASVKKQNGSWRKHVEQEEDKENCRLCFYQQTKWRLARPRVMSNLRESEKINSRQR